MYQIKNAKIGKIKFKERERERKTFYISFVTVLYLASLHHSNSLLVSTVYDIYIYACSQTRVESTTSYIICGCGLHCILKSCNNSALQFRESLDFSNSKLSFTLMNCDQEENVVFSPSTIYDQQYPDFIDNVLKEAADDFEREKKCM